MNRPTNLEQIHTPDSVSLMIHSITMHHKTVPSSVSLLYRDFSLAFLYGNLWFARYYLTSPASLRRDCTSYLPKGYKTSPTHSPCFQLHARLAKLIAEFAGRLLPYRFNPYQCSGITRKLAGFFSVAVVVKPLTQPALTYCFMRQPSVLDYTKQVEVGKFLYLYVTSSDGSNLLKSIIVNLLAPDCKTVYKPDTT
ncbi:hypothetical protein BH10CHL1_BH10CHL1_14970 [soil metagenome]